MNYCTYTQDILKEYLSFVHGCTSYNTRTATNILVYHKCSLFSARKICAFVSEFMNDRREKEAKLLVIAPDDLDCPNILPTTNKTRALLLLGVVERLPSYAHICGGMLICALAEYLTPDEWNEQLDYTEEQQNEKILWIEPFLRACILIKNSGMTDQQLYNFIEFEAEKMPVRLSFMRSDEYVEVTFVD